MALDNGNEQISNALIDLAALLRENFTLGDDVVTIKSEMEHAALYVKVMKHRSDCIINLIFDVEESMENNRAIKFTFQPIIENAIIHGFMKEGRTSGNITIKGCMEDKWNVVSINDDGAGFAIDRQTGNGFGLKSVEERLKLYSGENSMMEVESVVGKGTSVKLRWK